MVSSLAMRVPRRAGAAPGRRPSRGRAAVGLGVLALTVWLAIHTSGSLQDGLLSVAPALALAAFLAGGRYPAQGALVRLARVRATRTPAAGALRECRPRVRPRRRRRRPALIAMSLAGRAPPTACGPAF